MTSRDVDVVVVGLGIMGAAAARAIAMRGREVVGIERFAIGHPHGSSHGTSRIFRLSYDETSYVHMAIESLRLWRALEADTGERILITTGGLDIGTAVPLHAASLEAAGATFEVLEAAQAEARFPITVAEDEPVLFQPDAGIAAADVAWRSFISDAGARGAEIHEEEEVVSLRPSAPYVDVETSARVYRARVAVVTAGAWARPLLAQGGIDLPVSPTRETVAYSALLRDEPIPSVVDWTTTPARYALMAPGHGFKFAEHHAGPPTDPRDEGEVDRASLERLSGWVARRFPTVSPDIDHAETCIYTSTEDERFILERHGPIVVGSPCSGHGFKFAPLIGERLADLAG